MNDVLAQNIEAAPTLMPGSDVIYQNVQTNSHGVEYGKLLINQQSETYGVRIKKEIALFKVSDGLLILTGSASEDDYATLELVFQKVIDSIQLDQ